MNAPVICFGQQPCGFFPKRFLVAKILTARRLQKELGGEIVFFYHDSDHDPRETQTTLRHRKTNEPAILNFGFANKIQRKFSPLYLKQIAPDWFGKTELQLPNYVGHELIDLFKRVSAHSRRREEAAPPQASACPPPSGEPARLLSPSLSSIQNGGEGGRRPGEEALQGSEAQSANRISAKSHPGGHVSDAATCGGAVSIAEFCFAMYREMKLLDGIRIVRSGDPAVRKAACEIGDFFVDVAYQGEIVRARYSNGTFTLHEGGNSYITLPATEFTKEQISPTRDSRLRWMQSVVHCTHYIAGAGEQAYLRREDAPEITFVNRDEIDRSDEAWTEIT